jgi:hypothetical protein
MRSRPTPSITPLCRGVRCSSFFRAPRIGDQKARCRSGSNHLFFGDGSLRALPALLLDDAALLYFPRPVTWCPLRNSSVLFDGLINGRTLSSAGAASGDSGKPTYLGADPLPRPKHVWAIRSAVTLWCICRRSNNLREGKALRRQTSLTPQGRG